jgi:hypothetical protein
MGSTLHEKEIYPEVLPIVGGLITGFGQQDTNGSSLCPNSECYEQVTVEDNQNTCVPYNITKLQPSATRASPISFCRDAPTTTWPKTILSLVMIQVSGFVLTRCLNVLRCALELLSSVQDCSSINQSLPGHPNDDTNLVVRGETLHDRRPSRHRRF